MSPGGSLSQDLENPPLRPALVAALGVAAAVFALSLPPILEHWWLTPDAVEHLLIPWQWVHGAGFVDPVQYNYLLPDPPPHPGATVRAPLLPILLAAPLALGASVTATCAVHAAWASLVAGSVVLVARRCMRTTAAIATGLFVGLSSAWLLLARFVWNEATAVGAFLLVLATARGTTRSVAGGLLCALATGLAWLARPNLGALALAVVVAAGLELGLRRALRHAGLWSYLAGFALLVALWSTGVTATTGSAPNAGYRAALERFELEDYMHYQTESVGPLRFVQENSERVRARILERVGQLLTLLFAHPAFNLVGWLIPFGLVHAWRPERGAIELRVAAFSLLGLGALFVVFYPAADPLRYLVFPAVAAALCGMAALDAASRRLEARLGAGWRRSFLRAAPIGVWALIFGLGAGPGVASLAVASAQQVRLRGTEHRTDLPLDAVAGELCESMDPQAIVAAADPWSISLWCGNPAVQLPVDLDTPEWQARFMAEREPRYFVSDRSPAVAWLADSPAVRPLLEKRGRVLWEVRDPAPRTRTWRPAPPLACAGSGPDCPR